MLQALARDLAAYLGVIVATFVAPVVALSIPTLYFAKIVPPWALALVASLGTLIAAAVDYHLVRRVFRLQSLVRAREHRLFTAFERWAKVAPFLTVAVFAAFPLPFFIPRVLMPLSGYSSRRYAAAAALGRFPRVFVIATVGKALEIPNRILLALLAGGAALGLAAALVRRLRERRRKPPAPPASP